MSLKIFTAPKSITITDSDNNTVTVLKTSTGFEFYSKIANNGVNRHITAIGESVQRYIMNLIKEKNRDNYNIRFKNLAKIINGTKATSFSTLNKAMANAIA